MKKKASKKVEAKKTKKKISKKSQERKKLEEWKKAIRERDNYTCQICKKNLKENLRNCHIHHILDKKNFPHLKYDFDNGITLCYRCHKIGKCSAHLNPIFFTLWLNIHKPYYYNVAKRNLYEHKEIKKMIS